MSRGFLDEESRKAIASAVRDIEQRSAVEVVVVVRARSSLYLQVDLLLGFGSAYLTLAFMLLSPWPFDILWILLDPLIVGACAALLLSHFGSLQRLLVSRRLRRQAVRLAACTTFVERGVGLTRKRTGLLVYLSQLERAAELVADDGIRRAVDAAAWAKAVSSLEAVVGRGDDGLKLAQAIRNLGEILASALPRRPDDVNEIPDEVVVA
jgi:putative membrane protein